MSLPNALDRRVILLCGAGRGIGGATARGLAKAGATVAIVDLTQAAMDETIAEIKQAGGQCHGLVADLTDAAQTEGLVEKVAAHFGRLDGVVNVAGGTRPGEFGPLEALSLESFRTTINLNLEYVFRICRDAAALMIKNDWPGAFVNVGSISSLNAAPYHGPYGAAKSALATLSRTMALEWGRYGIRVNTVHPGMVLSERILKQRQLVNPDAKPGVSTSPEEVANTIVFLLSDLASGIWGQSIAVDSGVTMKFFEDVVPFEINKRCAQA